MCTPPTLSRGHLVAESSGYSSCFRSVHEHDYGGKRGSSRVVGEEREMQVIIRILNTTELVRSRGIIQVEGTHQVNLQGEKPAGENSVHPLLGGRRSPPHWPPQVNPSILLRRPHVCDRRTWSPGLGLARGWAVETSP